MLKAEYLVSCAFALTSVVFIS